MERDRRTDLTPTPDTGTMPRGDGTAAINQLERRLRPSTKAALRLYATGAVRTIPEAAAVVGMQASSLYLAKRSATGIALMDEMDGAIEKKSIDVSALIRQLSEKAVSKVAFLMNHAGSEQVQLAAAKDLLDRNPETSKTQKIQAEGFTLGSDDAKHLAAAMMQAVQIRASIGEAAHRDTLALAGEVVGEFSNHTQE